MRKQSEDYRKPYPLLLLLLFIVLTTSIAKNKKDAKSTIIQANHFYSSTDKTATYNIESVVTQKPLIFLLKDQEADSGKLKNPINIKLTSGKQIIDCEFKKLTDLCIIPKVQESNLVMNIVCDNLPCSVTWIIYQPQPQSPNFKQQAQNLYNLQKSSNHLIGQITCSDPSVKTFDKDITIYSQSTYKRAYINNIIYLLFNNEERGYVFVDVQHNSLACSLLELYNVPALLQTSDQVTKDFIMKDISSEFQINQIPTTNFLIQCSASRVDKNNDIKSTIDVTLLGVNNGVDQIIVSQKIKAVSRSQVSDFSFSFLKPDQKYKQLKLIFRTQSVQIIMINVRLVAAQVQQIQLGQAIYFNLNKGQHLKFKIQKVQDADDNQKYYLIQKRQSQIKLSTNQCLAKSTCQFQVEALEKTENMIYVSSRDSNSTMINEEGKGIYEFQQIQFIKINKKASHKMRMGDNVFFKKPMKKGHSFQVMINNPNVILYASSAEKCDVPDEKCRERTGNYHHPFVYQPVSDGNFLINVQGLDNGLFELTILDSGDEFIELTDGTPFSYTMDSQETRINFKFKLQKKSDVSFNLISPLNSLKLIVNNDGSNLPQLDTSQQSSDGYILFEKDQVNGLQFIVTVIKSNINSQYFTHFTIIASTNKANLRLEPSVTQYQTLTVGSYRDFVFQFDPTQDYILTFYTFNMKDEKIDIELKISDESKKWNEAKIMKIDKQTDFIDLKTIAQSMCEEQGVESCEVFLRITNQMDIEVDITINLLSRNALLELKDGIWQSYPENYMTASSSFYFYPRHAKKNIYIYYHTTLSSLKVAYRLWSYNKNEINPLQWPFPFVPDTDQLSHADYKTNNYISIDHEEMKNKCWPNCVLLITTYQEKLSSIMAGKTSNNNIFKIMASNNQMELPQKQKMSFSLGKGQDKQILMDTKYLLQDQVIKIYSTTTIGDCTIKGNVFSQKRPVCPTEDEQSDFLIFNGQTSIAVDDVKKKLKQHNMQDNKNIYLCLTVHSDSSCKMTIEYSGEEKGFKIISLDSFEQIKLQANQSKYYKVQGFIKQFAKITRVSGFPFIYIEKCTQTDKMEQCEQKFKNSTQKGKQIVVKTESFEEQPCGQCIFLFKFSSIEPSQVNFHLQSTFGQIQLKQNQILSDFLNEGQTNQYMLHSLSTEDTIVNINVQEGSVQATLTDLNSYKVNKMGNATNKIIHFVIKGKKPNQGNNSSKALINPMALSNDFQISHLSIVSSDSAKAASYTVTYSSGSRQINLQDGLIMNYALEPHKTTSFYYYNQEGSGHIYLSITMSNSSILNQIKIKAYYLQDIGDESTKKQYIIQKPVMAKKTPNPTIVANLPAESLWIIQLQNPTDKQQNVVVSINHKQLIILPFDHQFPFQLHQKQDLNILVDVNIPGFLEVTVRKCDRSAPKFSYTFDYNEFIKDDAMFTTDLNDSPYLQQTIKALRIGTLYINFKAQDDADSLLSIKIKYTEQKNKIDRLKAGKRGMLSYQLNSESSAKISVPSAYCSKTTCKNVKYFFMSSVNQQSLYSQLVCSSSFFTEYGIQQGKPLVLTKIDKAKETNGDIIIDYTLLGPVSYIGVKAVSETGQEVYYNPIQIATLYGKWSKQGALQRISMVILFLIVICLLAIFVRRQARKGYRPLEQLPD